MEQGALNGDWRYLQAEKDAHTPTPPPSHHQLEKWAESSQQLTEPSSFQESIKSHIAADTWLWAVKSPWDGLLISLSLCWFVLPATERKYECIDITILLLSQWKEPVFWKERKEKNKEPKGYFSPENPYIIGTREWPVCHMSRRSHALGDAQLASLDKVRWPQLLSQAHAHLV